MWIVLTMLGWTTALGSPVGDRQAAPERSAVTSSADAVVDASQAAQHPDLLGSACAWSTGTLVRRVLREGLPFTFVGTLREHQAAPSGIAAPYAVGPDDTLVLANQVLEAVVGHTAPGDRVALEGRLLTVDGTPYFVPSAGRRVDSDS